MSKNVLIRSRRNTFFINLCSQSLILWTIACANPTDLLNLVVYFYTVYLNLYAEIDNAQPLEFSISANF